MEKVAPSARFRAELDEALAGVAGDLDPIETVGRLGARLILQQAREDEVSEFLGRARYERVEDTVGHAQKMRTSRTQTATLELRELSEPYAHPIAVDRECLVRGVTRIIDSSPWAVRRAIGRGELVAYKLAGRLRIPEKALEDRCAPASSNRPRSNPT
jgi:hypothetical protein